MTISVNGTEVHLTLPSGRPVRLGSFVLSFNVSAGASVTLSGVAQTSGTSVNDFRNVLTEGEVTITRKREWYEKPSNYTVHVAGNGWVQEAYLKAPNADASDQFGRAVAIDGNTVIVGAERSLQVRCQLHYKRYCRKLGLTLTLPVTCRRSGCVRSGARWHNLESLGLL